MTLGNGRILSSGILLMAASLAVIGALHFGRGILIPMALAVLISLLLAPPVNRLQRWGLGRAASVLAVVVLSFGLMGWLSYILTRQVSDLARRLPEYRENIVTKTRSLQGPVGRAVGRVYESAMEISRELTTGDAGPGEKPPLQVEVVKPRPTAYQLLNGAVGAVIETLGAGAVVILLVVFLLLYRADLRDRMIHLAGVSQVDVTTETLDEAAGNVSRYLLLQTVVNACHGVAFGAGLFLIGVPNALLWGFLGAMLRFIPYLGPWIAAGFPVLLSLAAFPAWTPALLVVGFIIVLEVVSNNVIEPWIYGKRTGLSPLAVVLSAVFWAWLWGGVGLILAVPLTVCLVTLGRHVPALRFFNTLLGQNPGMDPEVRLYHRLLARDPDAAAGFVDAYMKGRTFQETCEKLFLPALALAEQNRHFGELDEDRARAFQSALRERIEEAAEQAPASPDRHAGVTVLCVPASDDADEIAAEMLVRLLRACGCAAEALSAGLATGEKVAAVEMKNPDLVCVSALPPGAILQTRHFLKRLPRRPDDGEVVVGLWNAGGDPALLGERLTSEARIHVATTLSEAMRQIQESAAALSMRKSSEV